MPSQRGSFAFYPKTTHPCITRGCSHWNEHGSAYLLMIWLRHGMGLTQESNRALPYLKRGRGNLRDKCIYFSTGLFASGAGRKRLLEFRPPAALLGRQREGPRRPGPWQGCPLGELPHPSLQHSLWKEGPAGDGETGLLAVGHSLQQGDLVPVQGRGTTQCPGTGQGSLCTTTSRAEFRENTLRASVSLLNYTMSYA